MGMRPSPTALDVINKGYLDTRLSPLATDSAVVHKTGNESIAGIKSFSDNVEIGTTLVPKQLSIKGNLLIDGNITQNGSTYETHAQQVYTTDDKIIMRDGATAGLISGATSGLTFKKYDGTHDGELSVDSSGTARVGDVGDLQPLATRNEAGSMTNNQPVVWDSSSLKMVTRALVAGDIPDLDAGKIKSGTIADARIPSGITRDTELTAHTSRTNNPHTVTKSQIGLSNVDNTSDIDKPISTATQTALNGTVKKTGDTMTGRLYANGGITIERVLEPVVVFKRTDISYDSPWARYRWDIIRDMDNKDVGEILFTCANNDSILGRVSSCRLMATNYKDDGFSVNGALVINATGSGDTYVTLPMRVTPGTTDAVHKGYLDSRLTSKQDKLLFESTPASGSVNPVTSGGIYNALAIKQALITGGATTITSLNLIVSRALVSDGNGKVAVSAVTSTELGYLDGVTSAIQTQLNSKASDTNLTAHTGNTSNPHGVTKAQVGLGNVDNTSDTAKPISTATQSALNAKQNNLTFDDVPVSGSTNPVKSGGIHSALATKANIGGTINTGGDVSWRPAIANNTWIKCANPGVANFVTALLNHQNIAIDISLDANGFSTVCRKEDTSNGDGYTTHSFLVPKNWWYRVIFNTGKTCNIVEQKLMLE